MTITATPAVADGRSPDDVLTRDRWTLAGHAAVTAALLWSGFGLTHNEGGRGTWSQTMGIALALLALAAVRPWRVLTARSIVLAAVVTLAPVVVCVIDPPHWFGASEAASYAYAAALFLVVRANAVTPGRRQAVVGVLLAAAVAQMAWSMIAWVGGGDPTQVMVGTFYWHNQFAAFLLAPAVLGAGLAAIGRGPLRLAGTLTTIFCSAGVVLSTSRATLALLVGGWVIVAVFAVLVAPNGRRRTATAVRVVVLGGVTALVTFLLPGPPLFPSRVSALASTAARARTQSLSQNGNFRADFWHQALLNFAHHPLTGTGFDSFGYQASRLDPTGPHSALVHSGLLQPLTDGGLLLAVPVLLSCLLVTVGLLSRLRPRSWSADGGLVTLLSVGSLLLLVHSAVDFDWTYPSLMVLVAVCAGAALAQSPSPAEPSPRVALVACAVLAVAACVLATQAVNGGWRLTAPVPHSVSASGESGS